MGRSADIVREAYRRAEGTALDPAGFRALFTEDGTFDDMGWGLSLRGDEIAAGVTALAQQIPDIHRELLQVHEFGDVVAVELRSGGRSEERSRLRPERCAAPARGSTSPRATSSTCAKERSNDSSVTTRPRCGSNRSESAPTSRRP